MSAKWVDTPGYVGLCRRSVKSKRRLLDRRSGNAAEKPPSVETLRRRLKVMEASTLRDNATRKQYLELLKAAHDLAAAQGDHAFAEEIRLRRLEFLSGREKL